MKPADRSGWRRVSTAPLLLPMLLLALLGSGCATYRNSQTAHGPGVDFQPVEVAQHREAQDQVLRQLYLLADLPAPEANSRSPALTSAQWDLVIRAGMDYADRKCEGYMHALFRLHRDKRTVVAQTGLIGTAVAGVMAAAESAAKDVAMVAIAFGLFSATVDNLSSNLLYDLDPSSVRTLVKALQKAYRDKLPTGYKDRPAAVSAIRTYALLCVPAAIEAEVNLAVKKAEPGGDKGDAETGKAPSVTNAVTTASADQSFRADSAGDQLASFIFPGGVTTANAENRARLETYMKLRGINNTSVVMFMRGADFAQERALAARVLNLTK